MRIYYDKFDLIDKYRVLSLRIGEYTLFLRIFIRKIEENWYIFGYRLSYNIFYSIGVI